MNSDLVYKKKYLKYKSKYTALQQQQQQGAGFGSLITGKGKFGWYLYLTTEEAYQKLFEPDLGFPMPGITLDKTNAVSKILFAINPKSVYIERTVSVLANNSKIMSCDTNNYNALASVTPEFSWRSMVNKPSINNFLFDIKPQVTSTIQTQTGSMNASWYGNTHWFVVDFDPSGNRFSKVFPMPTARI